MSRKPDIGKILARGSARKRSKIILQDRIRTLKGKPLLPEEEKAAIYESFSTPREREVYNEMMDSHARIVNHYYKYVMSFYDFERLLYRCKYSFLLNYDEIKEAIEKGDKNRNLREEMLNEIDIEVEDMIVMSYRDVINHYHAVLLFMKNKKYNVPEMLQEYKIIYNAVKEENYNYDTIIDNEVVNLSLKHIEPDQHEIELKASEI